MAYYLTPDKTSSRVKLAPDRFSIITRASLDSYTSNFGSITSSPDDIRFSNSIAPTSLTRESSIINIVNDNISRADSELFIGSPPTLKSLLCNGQTRIESVEHKLIRLGKQEVRCYNMQSNLIEDITSKYDRYIKILEQRKAQAILKVQKSYEPVLQFIISFRTRLEKQLKHLEAITNEATKPREIDIQVSSSSYETLDNDGDPITHSLSRIKEQFSELLNESVDDVFIPIPDLKFSIDKEIEFQLKCLGRVIQEVSNPPKDESLQINMGIASPYGLDVSYDGSLRVLDWETNNLYLLNVDGPNNASRCVIGKHLKRKSVHGIIGTSRAYYVTLPNKNSVRIISLDLKKNTDVTGIDWYVFNRPHGLARTSQENIVMADTGNNRILICTPTFTKVLSEIKSSGYGNVQLLHPREVAITPEQYIVVLHDGYPCIHVYSFTGNILYKFGSNGDIVRELDRPQSIAVAGNGDIIVGNVGFMAVYQADGVSMERIKRQGVVQRLAVTPEGRVIYRGVSKNGIMIESIL